MDLKNWFKNTAERIVGNELSFSLEARIFHAVSVVSIICLAVGIVTNAWLELTGLSVFMVVVSFLFTVSFYLSRMMNRLTLAISLFQVVALSALVFNYFNNSGIDGPTISLFLLLFVLALAISPRKQYSLWLPLNVVVISALLCYEYLVPEQLPNTYPTRYAQFVDVGITQVLIVIMLMLVSHYILKEFRRMHVNSLERARELELSNHTKNKLLSVLAHDLKEPLASIQSFLELLADFDLDDEERKHIEKGLLKRTQDTSILLANMLAWTKNQMEFVKVDLQCLGLLDCLEETLLSLKSIAQEKQISLEYTIPSTACVRGDANMLQLVIRNLVINAIKYTRPGGHIKVYSSVVNNKCHISVEDNGIGIPPDKQISLFSLTTHTTFGTALERGAGLGLVLCRDFMLFQHGSIGFSSRENEGSVFFVTLPLHQQGEKCNDLATRGQFDANVPV